MIDKKSQNVHFALETFNVRNNKFYHLNYYFHLHQCPWFHPYFHTLEFHHVNGSRSQNIINKSHCILHGCEKKILESPPGIFGHQVPLEAQDRSRTACNFKFPVKIIARLYSVLLKIKLFAVYKAQLLFKRRKLWNNTIRSKI